MKQFIQRHFALVKWAWAVFSGIGVGGMLGGITGSWLLALIVTVVVSCIVLFGLSLTLSEGTDVSEATNSELDDLLTSDWGTWNLPGDPRMLGVLKMPGSLEEILAVNNSWKTEQVDSHLFDPSV